MMFTTYAMLVPLWFGTATAAERCAFGPPAHPRPTPGEPARILFEMRIPNETPSAQIDAALKPLVQDSIPVLLLFSTGWTPDTPGWRPPIGTVEVGVWAPAGSLFETEVADWGAISDADWRTAFKDAKRRVFNATQSRPVAVASPPLPPAGEVALDDRGFSVFLVDDPTNTDLPRRARSFGNRMGRARVITEGVTSDSCGARLGTPSPSALDRVTRTAPSQVVSRVAIGPNPEESR
ncbi:MAG TPA: hypothetical protein DFR83_28375, partial [Deltaproteobacteria bacterium]|nr:hypothetical protein [Deltaproteobacteria bacterium]